MRYRIKDKEIVYELIEPPKNKNLKRGIIIFPGMPNQPRSENSDALASEGFYVLEPRYIGSWESYGKFNIDNCIKTIILAEKLFQKGFATECWSNKKIEWEINEITILSSSFGSSVVLSIAHKLDTRRFVCLAPLTNLNKHNKTEGIEEQDLKQVGRFIKRGFENAFREFDLSDWDRFVEGGSNANPIKMAELLKNKKMFLAHGKEDSAVHYSRTQEYYDKIKDRNEVKLKFYEGIGHGKQVKNASFEDVLYWIKE